MVALPTTAVSRGSEQGRRTRVGWLFCVLPRNNDPLRSAAISRHCRLRRVQRLSRRGSFGSFQVRSPCGVNVGALDAAVAPAPGKDS